VTSTVTQRPSCVTTDQRPRTPGPLLLRAQSGLDDPFPNHPPQRDHG
jgi:hypothetical protein